MADDSVRSVDINSLDLEEDEVQFNPELDATAAAPPVPDGVYRVKPSFRGGEPPNWQAKIDPATGKPTALWPKARTVFTITEGEHEGRVLSPADNIFVSTMVRRDGSSVIPTILNAMGLADEVKQCRKHQELAQLFERALEQGRELKVETKREARVKQADGSYKSFVQNGSDLKAAVVIGGEEVPVYAVIKKFLAG